MGRLHPSEGILKGFSGGSCRFRRGLNIHSRATEVLGYNMYIYN